MPDLKAIRALQKTVPCEICNATGITYLEHPDGSLSELRCPYCKGSKDSTWVVDRFEVRTFYRRLRQAGVVVYWVALLATNNLPFWSWSTSASGNPYPWLVHVGFWLVGLFLAYRLWAMRVPKARTPKQATTARANAAFTTDKEKLYGAAFIGGALLKADWDHRKKHG